MGERERERKRGREWRVKRRALGKTKFPDAVANFTANAARLQSSRIFMRNQNPKQASPAPLATKSNNVAWSTVQRKYVGTR